MNGHLGNIYTGSTPISNILKRVLNPLLLFQMLKEKTTSIPLYSNGELSLDNRDKELGVVIFRQLCRIYKDGEAIVTEGEKGDCMYIIQSGKVDVLRKKREKDIHLAYLYRGDFFGEMSLLDREPRSATVRAVGETLVLIINKKSLFNIIQKYPSMAFRIMRKLSSRIRENNRQLSDVKAADRRNWDTRECVID